MRARRREGRLNADEPYVAEPAPDFPGQKWLTLEEAQRIDEAMSRANRTLVTITDALLHKKHIARDAVAAHAAATTALLADLRLVIWREGGRPPTWRERSR